MIPSDPIVIWDRKDDEWKGKHKGVGGGSVP